MRILVTGRDGQLGRALAERNGAGTNGLSFVFTGRDRLDLLRPETFAPALQELQPDAIINAAAFTAVDKAEDEPDQAMAVNAAGAGRLAEMAAKLGVRFVQISTDYVFSGAKTEAYSEIDLIDPASVYGQSKAAGEIRVREAGGSFVIVRTAWVYSPFGINFPKTMLRLAAERDEIRVVNDQRGTPTSAFDLADGLIAMCSYWLRVPDMGLGRTYHLAGSGEASWADVARETLAISNDLGGPRANVTDISSKDYPTKARRPSNSRLDSGLFRETFGYKAPDWQTSLKVVVRRLLA